MHGVAPLNSQQIFHPESPTSPKTLDQSRPEAVRALSQLSDQCGNKSLVFDILKLLRSIGEYAGRSGSERKLDMRSTGFQDKVGKFQAGRDLLLMLGFQESQKDTDCLHIKEGITVDPAVMCAINGALLRAGDGSAQELHVLYSSPTTPLTPLEERPSFLSPVSKRHPLSNRLPKMDLSDALVSDSSCITSSIRDGSSCVCPDCKGVITVDRFEQHCKHWCPAQRNTEDEEN